MADEIPQIPQVEEILVNTGNVVNWNRLRRKLTQSPEEEVLDCIGTTISEWKATKKEDDLQSATRLECINERFRESLVEEDRGELKITVKIFCPSLDCAALVQAVDRVLDELQTDYIETVLLAVPEGKEDLETIKPLWETLETMVHGDKVLSIGVAEFSKDQLEVLTNWAQIKPCIVQINLAICCVVPPDLQEYAKENDVLLLTHNDPKDVMPEAKFQEMITRSFTSRDAENWQPSWIVRYSVLIKCRGVIKSKSYLMRGYRDLKRRK